MLEDIIVFKHRYCHFINISGKCVWKAKEFNAKEAMKLDIAKQQWKIATREQRRKRIRKRRRGRIVLDML